MDLRVPREHPRVPREYPREPREDPREYPRDPREDPRDPREDHYFKFWPYSDYQFKAILSTHFPAVYTETPVAVTPQKVTLSTNTNRIHLQIKPDKLQL